MAYIFQTRTASLESRNRAALASGQAAFETAPELADDDELTEDDARDQAEAEVLTTTEPLADWIAKKCDCDQGRAPIDVARFEDVDLIDCDRVPVLLACIVAGDYSQMRAAACRLRTLYLKAERRAVEARTTELLASAVTFTPAEIAAVRAVMPHADDMTITRHLRQRAEIVAKLGRAPRFLATYCSQCGRENGPGDAGTSNCWQRRGLR